MWQVANQLFWRRISVLTFKTHVWQHLSKASVSERINHTVRFCTVSLQVLNCSFSGLPPLVAVGREKLGRKQIGFVHSFIPISIFACVFVPQRNQVEQQNVWKLCGIRTMGLMSCCTCSEIFSLGAELKEIVSLNNPMVGFDSSLWIIMELVSVAFLNSHWREKKYFSGMIPPLQICNPGWTNSHRAVPSLESGLPAWVGIPT